ncbi:MAG: thiamine/thiamine pyrophosphate ABC transporter permease ThiP [Pseudomonadota bacterium]
MSGASSLLPGVAVLAAFIGFVITALVLLAMAGGGVTSIPFDRLFGSYSRSILAFTLTQTTLSVALSLLGALPVAVVLHRYASFPGHAALVRLLALPLALPPLVAVLGLLDVWGRAGLVGAFLNLIGLDVRPNIFGLHGVVLAHVFFNLPLTARLMLSHLERQPATTFRLADQLGLAGWSRFWRVEWPLLRDQFPGIAALVVMLCIGSFTIVLTLGGGPSSATFEVAIYQALRFDFDPPLAVLYTLVQLALALVILGLLRLSGRASEDRAGGELQTCGYARTLPLWAVFILVLLLGLLVAPLAALVIAGLGADWLRLLGTERLWSAILTSFVIALSAGTLATLSAYLVLVAKLRGFEGLQSPHVFRHFFNTGYSALGSAVLVVPPIVLVAGWFLALRGWPAQSIIAGGLVVLVNALMALPFVLRVLGPAFEAAERRYGPLRRSLHLTGWPVLLRMDLPVLARPFLVAVLFAFVLSVGDLGAAVLFGAYDLVTLPVLILSLMGSYRTGDAVGVALLLGLFVFALMALAERIHKVMA